MTSGRPFAEVIGDPISHSRSPQIHGFWLDQLGLAADYSATRVQRSELKAFVAGRRTDPDWRGCNVTMPLKLDALMLADEGSDRATAAGAANLLFVRDGSLLAANTDVGAVARLVAPLLGDSDSITLLGNGGAARAVLVAFRLLGRGQVRLQARDLAAARKLAVEFDTVEPVRFDTPVASIGLINATPLGMTGHPPFELNISHMSPGGWVMDLVTDPDPTALIRSAREGGLRTVDGLAVLIEQAAESFELLFGRPAPRDKDAELLLRLRP
ncbi:shikimate dehydrogenase [Sphingomonas sp. HDW15A]|uniref:shikimate dehydrogenase family protein n=1 Tax=Sphingomonas sp. HDW15A TaxID=2714942 RepID=UPI00140E88C8|nr:shikimate dehydrogenase [Sphingomonas sp. HDW15A]QIK97290.1 shikimate dehydrogenase [Sphingomonas sp. HDW15A]